jgi:hypothetical protein
MAVRGTCYHNKDIVVLLLSFLVEPDNGHIADEKLLVILKIAKT